MRTLSALLASSLLLILAGGSGAGICESYASMHPWDSMGYQAFVSPGAGAVDIATLTIYEFNCESPPYKGVHVEIELWDCSGLCLNLGDAGLEEITDSESQAIFNPRVGGCADCQVIVKANGVVIGLYDGVRSPDWDGFSADGVVSGKDFAFFGAAFTTTQDACADYTGDGAVSGPDFALFAQAFRGGDANNQGCE